MAPPPDQEYNRREDSVGTIFEDTVSVVAKKKRYKGSAKMSIDLSKSDDRDHMLPSYRLVMIRDQENSNIYILLVHTTKTWKVKL